MPVIGFLLAKGMEGREGAVRSENVISRISGGIWSAFGIFACSVALFHLLFPLFNANPIGTIAVGTSLSAQIILLFGFAEAINGIALKNWAVTIAGFLTGIGGLALYYGIGLYEEQMFLFTADRFEGTLNSVCDEGELRWIPKERIGTLNLWEGDRLFLKLLSEDAPFFLMKLEYCGDRLERASVDGAVIEI